MATESGPVVTVTIHHCGKLSPRLRAALVELAKAARAAMDEDAGRCMECGGSGARCDPCFNSLVTGPPTEKP